jgi:hypothetical protein
MTDVIQQRSEKKKDEKKKICACSNEGHGNAEDVRIRACGHSVAVEGVADIAKTPVEFSRMVDHVVDVKKFQGQKKSRKNEKK